MKKRIYIKGNDYKEDSEPILIGHYELWKCKAVAAPFWDEDWDDDGNYIDYDEDEMEDCATYIRDTEDEFGDGAGVLFGREPYDFESEEELEEYLENYADEFAIYTYYENGIYFTA